MKYFFLAMMLVVLSGCGGGGGGSDSGSSSRPVPPGKVQQVPFDRFVDDMMSNGVAEDSKPLSLKDIEFVYEEDANVALREF